MNLRSKNTPSKKWNPNQVDDLFALSPTQENQFESLYSEHVEHRGVFGGQVLGQALAAASAQESERLPVSMHARFIKPVQALKTVTFTVDALQNGRSYGVTQVRAYQDDQQVLYADLAFALPRDGGLVHQSIMPDNIPPPESLQSLQEFARSEPQSAITSAVRLAAKRLVSFEGGELKPCDPMGLIQKRPTPKRQFWAKLKGAQSGYLDQNHAALTTYLSDYWMAGAGMMAMHHHNMPDAYPAAISLDHAIWFYDPAPLDDWIFFDVDSPFAKGGLGVCRALLYHRDGRLLASVSQNVLMRLDG